MAAGAPTRQAGQVRQRRGIPRVALVAWLALIVGVAIWTERRLADRSDAAPPAPAASPAPAAPPRPHRPARPASLPEAATPRLRLEGHVIDPDGRDVEGAVVTLDRDLDRYSPVGAARGYDGTAAARTTSDAAGRFMFEAIEPGIFQISAAAGPLLAGPIRCTSSDAARPLVIRLEAGVSATVTVSDEAGAAIPGAHIEAHGVATGDTDARGRATLGPLRPGWIDIAVHAAGRAAGSQSVNLDAPGAHAEIAVTLYRGVPVSGRIVDEHRQPIAGARIAVISAPPSFHGEQIASDDRGEFAVAALVRGVYTLDVTADGYVPARNTVTVDRSAVHGVEIAMTAGGTITGIVVDTDHRAVAFATIIAWPRGRTTQTTGDAGGNFELRGIATGNISVAAVTPAGQRGSATVRLSAAADTPDIEIVIDGVGTIAGTVVDDHGAALPGIGVTAYVDYSHRSSGAGGGSRYGHAITDGAGRFVITGLADMSYLVHTSRRDRQPASWPPPGSVFARTGDRDVRLSLLPGGRLTGRLVDQTGTPVDAARVGVADSSTASGRDGVFDIRDIPPGRHDVRSLIGGAWTVARQEIEVRSGETTDLGTLTVARDRPGRTLTGRVVDPTGAPLGNVRVDLGVIRPPPVDVDDPPGGFHAHRTAYTTPDGSLRIADIPPTPMLALATDFVYGASATLAIPTAAVCPGDPPAITLVLSPRDAR